VSSFVFLKYEELEDPGYYTQELATWVSRPGLSPGLSIRDSSQVGFLLHPGSKSACRLLCGRLEILRSSFHLRF